VGARSNKTLREKAKQSKSAAAAAAMKKFKKKPCSFCRDKVTYIDYKDIATLRKYITDRGKIRSRRITGACTQHQRAVAAAVKNSREMAPQIKSPTIEHKKQISIDLFEKRQ